MTCRRRDSERSFRERLSALLSVLERRKVCVLDELSCELGVSNEVRVLEWCELSVRYLQIPTRTVCQVRTHAQKYFSKLEKDVICVAARVDRVETKGCFVWQPLVRVSVFVSE